MAKTKKSKAAKKKVVTTKKTAPVKKADMEATVKKAIVSIQPEPIKAIVPVAEMVKAIQPVANADKPARDISYDPQAIEKKWREKWEEDKLYRSVIDKRYP